MSSKKKDLEIICDLEWKNKPTNGDEKSNMVGILDLPATTLDWKTFKSYVLKHSGATDDNVKVSYIDSEDRERPINSPLDFEIALHTFRHRAKMNEIITLKLESVNGKKNGVKGIAKELSEVQKKLNPIGKKSDKPPEWFLAYMKKFKEELLEEISVVCSSKTHQINAHHARKLKADRQRSRKTPLLFGDVINDKELSKSAKMERKLESKLEKLEHKTLKIKAKKMALRGSSDSDVGRSSGKNDTATYLPPNSSDMSMNASVLKREFAPHMIGGESYCQTWEVGNSGSLPWTSDTELRYAWGSQALKPVNKEVPCPTLQPGEKGKISVFLEIPKIPGTYECYWHFYHEGRRFGHWLGCEIIVDGPPVKNIPFLPSPTYDVINIQDTYELVLPTSMTSRKIQKDEMPDDNPDDFVNPFKSIPSTTKCVNCFPPLNVFEEAPTTFEKAVDTEDMDKQKDDVQIAEEENKLDTNPFSDSDNQSIISISDSSVNSATSEDFVLLKMSPKEDEKDAAKEEATLSPNATNTNSLEVTVEIETFFNKLYVGDALQSKDDATVDEPSELQFDRSDSVGKEDFTFEGDSIDDSAVAAVDSKDDSVVAAEDLKEDGLITAGDLKEDGLITAGDLKEDGPIVAQAVVQQKPIDLSNKSVAYEDGNEETDDVGYYAYVHYKGRKIPISRKHLRPEFLATAEIVPESELRNLDKLKIDDVECEPVKDTDPGEDFRTSTPSIDSNQAPPHYHQQQQQQQQEEVKTTCSMSDVPQSAYSFCSLSVNNGTDCASNCGMGTSMTSSMNENRFFVFPQYYPGYEVVPPLATNYVDPNAGGGLPFQPVYGYNTVGEVLVNDWTTGLNYTACVRYPNQPNQYYSPPGNSTSNTSRGCSSIPNSNSGTPLNQSHPQSPRESPTANSYNGNGYCRFEHQNNVNINVNDDTFSNHHSTTTNSNRSATSENANPSTNCNQSKPASDSRGSSRVGVPDLLSGATVVATSAINTARSVLNMFVPPRNPECGHWQNGHWTSTNPESKREKNLRILHEMGFLNRDLNATLLARYNDDIYTVLSELLQ
ncbi:hypothetical protein Trydic_g2899 [Trypoxylus dichotomus]